MGIAVNCGYCTTDSSRHNAQNGSYPDRPPRAGLYSKAAQSASGGSLRLPCFPRQLGYNVPQNKNALRCSSIQGDGQADVTGPADTVYHERSVRASERLLSSLEQTKGATALDAKEIVERYEAGERDFRWVDLHGADLTGAKLKRVDLSEATLTLANLREASLYMASLYGADLGGAILSEANLNGADLSNADLRGAELYDTYLKGATLTRTNLRGAILTRAILSEANLISATLTSATLTGVNLRRANLSGATVTPKQLAQAKSRKGTTMPDGTVHP